MINVSKAPGGGHTTCQWLVIIPRRYSATGKRKQDTFATYALKAGTTLPELQLNMGHRLLANHPTTGTAAYPLTLIFFLLLTPQTRDNLHGIRKK